MTVIPTLKMWRQKDQKFKDNQIENFKQCQMHETYPVKAKQGIQEMTYHLSKDKLLTAKMCLFYTPVLQPVVALSKKRTKIVI